MKERCLPKFWELKELPEFNSFQQTESLQRKNFLQTHVRLMDGTFHNDFLFKYPVEEASRGDSFYITKKRFCYLEERFQNNPELFSNYKNFVDEYVSLKHSNYFSLDPSNKTAENKYFDPHHCLIKYFSETTKLRVVWTRPPKFLLAYRQRMGCTWVTKYNQTYTT